MRFILDTALREPADGAAARDSRQSATAGTSTPIAPRHTPASAMPAYFVASAATRPYIYFCRPTMGFERPSADVSRLEGAPSRPLGLLAQEESRGRHYALFLATPKLSLDSRCAILLVRPHDFSVARCHWPYIGLPRSGLKYSSTRHFSHGQHDADAAQAPIIPPSLSLDGIKYSHIISIIIVERNPAIPARQLSFERREI